MCICAPSSCPIEQAKLNLQKLSQSNKVKANKDFVKVINYVNNQLTFETSLIELMSMIASVQDVTSQLNLRVGVRKFNNIMVTLRNELLAKELVEMKSSPILPRYTINRPVSGLPNEREDSTSHISEQNRTSITKKS